MPARIFTVFARAAKRWTSAPMTYSALMIGRFLTATGEPIATAGEKLQTIALNRLAVITARSPRKYPPIVALVLGLAAWVPLIVLFLLLKERF